MTDPLTRRERDIRNQVAFDKLRRLNRRQRLRVHWLRYRADYIWAVLSTGVILWVVIFHSPA